MKKHNKLFYSALVLNIGWCSTIPMTASAQYQQVKSYITNDANIPESAKPWVFWYWMHASFNKEAVTADLLAMKEAGIAGAYIAPIKGKTNPPLYEPVTETLTEEWWDIFKYTIEEANRIGVKIALLPNDGFATAGGPWIKPEMSMQKVVWTESVIKGNKNVKIKLAQPESYEGYYKDIAVLAFPKLAKTQNIKPKVTTSNEKDASFLIDEDNKQNFGSNEPCWIQYEYAEPFLARSIKIAVNGYNYQSHRLTVQTSNDGVNFTTLTQLHPARVGWLDWDAAATQSIPEVKAKYFRFVYDPEGSEPGAEDLDAAKWKQSLKIKGIALSADAKIHHFEGKSGMVWRIADRESESTFAKNQTIPLDKVIDISSKVDKDGNLNWKAPSNEEWTVLRVGHTSTGHKNETAGAGKGLECDKFNPEVVKFQFEQWFGKAFKVVGPELSDKVLKVFHVDSWECGSQNWSPVFAAEFKKKRGYDLTKYLPALAGFPIGDAKTGSVETSEKFLHDVRLTISELMNDNFFNVLKKLAEDKGAIFTSETTAPVMVGDGLAHFGQVDVPMGEFWLRSPSHDKPNDILDAVSGARIYNKNIVQAEAFTQIRMEWDEHPGNIKTLQDRNYALGINKLVYHIYVHNPWMGKKPGMTLDGIGLYFQKDQTWWKPGKAWVDYAQRSQVLLQQGTPVVDIAVFAGDELPRRAVLPERLVSTLPGIFGEERVASEKERLTNKGNPVRRIAGVTTAANIAQPEDWINPLNGYQYDTFNPEVLAKAKVVNGEVFFNSTNAYKVLVLPQASQMTPNAIYSVSTLKHIEKLINEGAKVVLNAKPVSVAGLTDNVNEFNTLVNKIWEGDFTTSTVNGKQVISKNYGKGVIVKGPYLPKTLDFFGVSKDFVVNEVNGTYSKGIGYTHRKSNDLDIYFITNQLAEERHLEVSLRVDGRVPELYDAVSGKVLSDVKFTYAKGRTYLPLQLEPNASVFIILTDKNQSQAKLSAKPNWSSFKAVNTLSNEWSLKFDENLGGPKEVVKINQLSDLSKHSNNDIKYYSGTISYQTNLNINKISNKPLWLDLGEVANLAEVKINGKDCGVLWTYPYRLDISKMVTKGNNKVEILVTNTWANRLIGDKNLPEDKRVTFTTAPIRIEEKDLQKTGLIGPVKLLEETK